MDIGLLRTNYDGFTWISLSFRAKYINVYLKGQFEGDEEFIKNKFIDPITLNTWRDGFSVLVTKESQFNDVVKWLKLD